MRALLRLMFVDFGIAPIDKQLPKRWRFVEDYDVH